MKLIFPETLSHLQIQILNAFQFTIASILDMKCEIKEHSELGYLSQD